MAERLLRRLAAIDPAQVYLRQPATYDEVTINALAIAACGWLVRWCARHCG
jgi:hypothetical protein